MVTVLKSGADRGTIRKIVEGLNKRKSFRGIDANKFSGRIKLKEDPLIIQKRMRDEWE